jgi:hypothetical protein
MDDADRKVLEAVKAVIGVAHNEVEIRKLLASLHIATRPYWNGVITSVVSEENVDRIRQFMKDKD